MELKDGLALLERIALPVVLLLGAFVAGARGHWVYGKHYDDLRTRNEALDADNQRLRERSEALEALITGHVKATEAALTVLRNVVQQFIAQRRRER